MLLNIVAGYPYDEAKHYTQKSVHHPRCLHSREIAKLKGVLVKPNTPYAIYCPLRQKPYEYQHPRQELKHLLDGEQINQRKQRQSFD